MFDPDTGYCNNCDVNDVSISMVMVDCILCSL